MSSGRIIKADGDGSALGPLSLPQVDRLGPPGLAALVGPAAGKFIAAEAGEHADTISAMLAVFPYLFPPETNNWSKAPMISPGSQLELFVGHGLRQRLRLRRPRLLRKD
jgi:hypothetical protein